jgi:hypothetical protein
MMLFGRQIAARLIAMVVGGVLIVALAGLGLYQCDKRRDQAAQARVERGQAGAASESAKDAIGTVSSAGRREAGSEELTRSNEREIRGADGANERIGPGVDYAGRAALCRREAYRNDPKCKVMKP